MSILLVINTNGNSNEVNRIRVLKVKTEGDPVEKYLERKDAYESDMVVELTNKQIKSLKKRLNKF